MATRDAGDSGVLDLTATGAERPTVSMWAYQPAFYAQTYLAFYKMYGKCSTHTWDSWVNSTGDESGRDVHGVQEAGTITATWFIPQGF